jgi:hypothetical protein
MDEFKTVILRMHCPFARSNCSWSTRPASAMSSPPKTRDVRRRCPRVRTVRRNARMGCTRSSCREPRSRVRERPTSAGMFQAGCESRCIAVCSWFYRIRPSVTHRPFTKLSKEQFTNNFSVFEPNPNQLRWHPHPIDDGGKVDFIQVLYLRRKRFSSSGSVYDVWWWRHCVS